MIHLHAIRQKNQIHSDKLRNPLPIFHTYWTKHVENWQTQEKHKYE
jgi:hypothetical protein